MRIHTPTSIFISINGRWLEAAQQIQWQETITRRPLYGVLSTRFTDLSHGRLNISGTIGIYFDSLGSFRNILLHAWDQKLSRTGSADSLIGKRAALIKKQIKETLDPVVRLQLLNELQQAAFSTTDVSRRKAARQAIELLNNDFIPNNLPKFTPGELYYNPLSVEKITDIKDLSMDIVYTQQPAYSLNSSGQRENLKLRSIGERFVDVRFVAKTKGFANGPKEGGQPVMEFYQFIAKDVTHQE